MTKRQPLRRFKFVYQTRFNEDHDYKKILYASTTQLAWTKFNNHCNEHNIVLHDASVELME